MSARIASILMVVLACTGVRAAEPRLLDDFERIDQWKTVASDSVTASLQQVDGVHGKALCLDYNFNGVSGYAVARRLLPITYPANYEFALQLRGSGPVNNLEFKLGDSGGDNVWWVDKPNFPLPSQWTALTLKKRQIVFAWGPNPDKYLHSSQSFEMTISAGNGGGKGKACIDDLAFRELPAADGSFARPLATASAQTKDGQAGNAVDGNAATAWRAPAGAQTLTLDLGAEREFGGLTLHWAAGRYASRYAVALSDDGHLWRTVRTVAVGNGNVDPIALPESQSRYVRLQLQSGPGPDYALNEIAIEPLEFAATPNDFLKAVAKQSPRGWFPRGFIGEQPYWTLVGVDGGSDQGLIGEDGAIELGKGRISVTPVVLEDRKLVTWSDVETSQSLLERYLPIPSVQWTHRDFGLRITAFGQDRGTQSRLLATYRLVNHGSAARDFVLALTVQPFQVNPPSQFLNTAGGFVPIDELRLAGKRVMIGAGAGQAPATVLESLQQPEAVFATQFDAGMVVERLARGDVLLLADQAQVHDETSLASGALLFRMHLKSGESREVSFSAPLATKSTGDRGATSASGGNLKRDASRVVATAQASVAKQWQAKLNDVTIKVPPREQHVVDTLRTALANMLISRVGARLQPGTRSYARAWIRDGAMMSDALLRLGRADVAEDFVRWYARYQFPTGKVPCCVDDRGADPVPENDSQGEFIHGVAEVYRYTRDDGFLAAMWPHVAAAVDEMEALRGIERTAANQAVNAAFFGLMPASISHEGYSAKPMHSYWDDFWSLRGYEDAVAIAAWTNHQDQAVRWTAFTHEFRADVLSSISTAVRQKGIDFIPGSAELGDFDATSTTIALAPGNEQEHLPATLLRNTFERYWIQFKKRRDGKRAWADYTPYELRTIGSFVRLGWRDRAQEALAYFTADQQPVGWNQWAEVVSHTPRKPFFLGDLPHAWVASDYARSVLDLFAYERGEVLVLAAGIPRDWMQDPGVAVSGLHTPYGLLGYSLREDNGALRLHVDAGASPPGGFVFTWPYAGEPRAAIVDGKQAQWHGAELRIAHSPAEVRIEAPRHVGATMRTSGHGGLHRAW